MPIFEFQLNPNHVRKSRHSDTFRRRFFHPKRPPKPRSSRPDSDYARDPRFFSHLADIEKDARRASLQDKYPHPPLERSPRRHRAEAAEQRKPPPCSLHRPRKTSPVFHSSQSKADFSPPDLFRKQLPE